MLSLALCLALVLMPPRRDRYGQKPPRGAEVPNADGVPCCFVYPSRGNQPCGVTAASRWYFAYTADGSRLWCHAGTCDGHKRPGKTVHATFMSDSPLGWREWKWQKAWKLDVEKDEELADPSGTTTAVVTPAVEAAARPRKKSKFISDEAEASDDDEEDEEEEGSESSFIVPDHDSPAMEARSAVALDVE